MSSSEASTSSSIETAELSTIDMALEVVQLPVSDIDRAKRFYQNLGWRFDIDLVVGRTCGRCSSRRHTRPARSSSAGAVRTPSRGRPRE